MALFKTYGAFILLHGTYFLLVMFLILRLLESRRTHAQIAVMTVSAIAPFFFIGFLLIAIASTIPSLARLVAYVTLIDVKLVLAFPVLWLGFKVDVRLAVIYTILLLVFGQFSVIFARALLQLFEGEAGAMIYILVAAAVPVAMWVATRRIGDPAGRMLARCILLAALIAPTLVVGHGGFAILPAVMVWSYLLHGSLYDAMIHFGSLAISVTVTTIVILLFYKATAKAQVAAASDSSVDI